MRTTKIQFADAGSAATIVKMACERVEGFSALYTRFERKMSIAGKSRSTITNYGCHILLNPINQQIKNKPKTA